MAPQPRNSPNEGGIHCCETENLSVPVGVNKLETPNHLEGEKIQTWHCVPRLRPEAIMYIAGGAKEFEPGLRVNVRGAMMFGGAAGPRLHAVVEHVPVV